MASPATDLDDVSPAHESPPEAACREAQKWIEQVTGRCFGDKDFRTGLENGILLCELLNAIKPGLIKKINRLPTPIAGLDNVTLFLRGCKELGLKESQLFDPGDLQDTSNRTTVRISDCNRKLRNVLVTVYWLGKAANSCAAYSGNHLDLKEFEGLLAQMRKENEDVESPKRSIRDSGYIDCWDSERSDSLSPPRHGRDDSFDSLDSFGSRSQQTPSPDVVLRGSSDGRGSDSESDQPHRRLPDVRKDDMSARRVSFGENKASVPFNQYLPNKSNQTAYIPAPLRKKRVEHDYRKSWSTATSPLGGERPFSPSHPETIEEEQVEGQNGEHGACSPISVKGQLGNTEKLKGYFDQQEDDMKDQPSGHEDEEARKLKSLQKFGIKVMPAAKRYNSPKQFAEDHETVGIVLQKENRHPAIEDSEEEEECKIPDIERDDLATRRARMNQPKVSTPFNQYIGSYIPKTKPAQDSSSATTSCTRHTRDKRKEEPQDQPAAKAIILKENLAQRSIDIESDHEEEERVPDVQRDDLAKRKTYGSVPQQKEPLAFSKGSITKADMATWQRLKLSSEESESMAANQTPGNHQEPKIDATRAANDDFGRRKLSLQEKRARNKQKFVHFGPVTEIDQKRWDRLCIAKPGVSETDIRNENDSDVAYAKAVISASVPSVHTMDTVPVTHLQCQSRCTAEVIPDMSSDNEHGGPLPDAQRDDMLARRIGTFQKCTKASQPSSSTGDNPQNIKNENLKTPKDKPKENKQPLEDDQLLNKDILPEVTADLKPENDKPETHAPQLNSEEVVCNEDTNLQKDRCTPDPEKDDMMVRRISVSQRPPGVALTHFLPVPFSLQKSEEKSNIFQPKEKKSVSSLHMTTITPNITPQAQTAVRSDSPSKTVELNTAEEPSELRDDLMCQPACNPIETNPICAELKSQPPQESLESADREVSRFSTRLSLSDDAESVSMCDMRYEDDGNMLPHSRAHHEHLQFVNDLLKEEDDTWQDDLARWKTRRRSASQDLIKKEEERKKMERVLSGEPDLTERRKSIKTYKEIVEEKERREKELHEAYKNAKTKEEAEKILQKYIERFTISEAVLERLVMPKILERSHSVEPGLLSSSEDPNPLKYLRQQSLPSPKFTSTVEATISPTSESDFKAPLGPTSPTKSVVSKAVPMLTPKPYSQPRNTQQVLKNFKVDGKVSMNGEAMNGTEEHKEAGFSATHQMFAPSLTRSQMFEGVARVDVPAVLAQTDGSSIELSLKKPSVQNSVTDKILSEERNHSDVVAEKDLSLASEVHIEKAAEGTTQQKPIVTSLEFTPSLAPPVTVVNGKDQEEEQKVDPKSLTLDFSIKEDKESALQQVKTTREDGQEALQKEQHGDKEISGSSAVLIPALNSPSRFCSWDPEEERRRQERWQQEQERLLQERYQKEQEKLKEEWEKAQKEVEEEERKYYEEERKIIEDTLMPLSVSPAASLHRDICEMNGSLTSSHREQETTSEETWTEAKSCVKPAIQPEDIKPHMPQWTLEGSINRQEEQKNGARLETEQTLTMTETESNYTYQQCNTPTSLHLQLGVTSGSNGSEDVASLNNFEDSKSSQPRSPCVDSKGLDPLETSRDTSYSSQSSSQCQSPNRSVSGKKLCSTCGQPLGKGAAMIIETLSLYFHIQCFKCGICKGQLGDATTGTDVRIRNGLLNCNDCYVRSRTAGHPTPL